MVGNFLSEAVAEPAARFLSRGLDLNGMESAAEPHVPVMKEEVVNLLLPSLEGCVVDATVGAGGHAEALLDRSRDMSVIGLDRDPSAVLLARERLERFGERARIRNANFRNLHEELEKEGVGSVSAVLFDLGLSTMQIRDESRGFSFSSPGPLDMRMGPDAAETAGELIDSAGEGKLAEIIRSFGEERHYRRVARAIAEARRDGKLKSGSDLAALVASAVPRSRGLKIHPATRTFQALRIAVNDELKALEVALPQALEVLRPGGVLAVISFHSLEDRIVKTFFKAESRDCLCPADFPVCRCGHKRRLEILTKKPLVPSEAEIERNPASRSAKLRAARRVE